ncbi:MAG: hypothetical protein ACPGAN_06050 [Candidatus Poseidoniaceae archaeon]
MPTPVLNNIEVFKTTVQVMLEDGVLTREEKRLVIKLSSALGLSENEPGLVYKSIREGTELPSGREISEGEAREIFMKIFEVALVNASLSLDEFRVLDHLRETFGIDETDFNNIKSELEGIIKEKYDDPNVLEKVYEILKDGVNSINDRIDNLTKKSQSSGDE